jgi:hypothetical protein
MDERNRFYGRWPVGSSQFHHHSRVVHIECADEFVSIARRVMRPPIRNVGWACRLLMKAAAAYGAAGLSRRSEAVWRYARLVHRARSREAGVR